MIKRFLSLSLRRRAALVAGIVALLSSTTLAIASTNTISLPASTAAERNFTVTPDGLKPEQCSTITVSVVKSGAVTVTGTTDNDLLLAEDNATQLVGGAGNDCLVSGAGSNTLNGGPDLDICIGGLSTLMVDCETEIRT